MRWKGEAERTGGEVRVRGGVKGAAAVMVCQPAPGPGEDASDALERNVEAGLGDAEHLRAAVSSMPMWAAVSSFGTHHACGEEQTPRHDLDADVPL